MTLGGSSVTAEGRGGGRTDRDEQTGQLCWCHREVHHFSLIQIHFKASLFHCQTTTSKNYFFLSLSFAWVKGRKKEVPFQKYFVRKTPRVSQPGDHTVPTDTEEPNSQRQGIEGRWFWFLALREWEDILPADQRHACCCSSRKSLPLSLRKQNELAVTLPQPSMAKGSTSSS